ncbi:double-strand break repair helicase AddA [Paralimibaculum aggregatum]|uniref:DNA 3'-5' helicase n=1 Tax=Paralimibaculum aggregatum TaxID=3036245 RepID=A0ABQ6LQM0_9RHOB|nr:double-strand break repair helicase AddA [Limibaculum sp. NKW23]GMG82915.1 double-strand break repair helicase AddA [Limibaculum sp. NKW23]
MSRQGPTPAQAEAADPASSAWVSANAGSGKTRVLAERVARLLLAGEAPERILCLTYTRAAAVEMQSRLFRMLGGWTMAPDAALAEDLERLSGGTAPAGAAALARARRLFAAALETPGGLKIQTIHAFCTQLLQRFPLEAGVSQRFTVLDDRDTAQIVAEICRQLALAAEAGEAGTGFDAVAARLSDELFDSLVKAVLAARPAFAAPLREEDLARLFGAEALLPRAEIVARALAEVDWPALTGLGAAMAAAGKSMGRPGALIAEAAERAAREPEAALEALQAVFLTDKFEPRKRGRFPTKAVLEAVPAGDALTDEMIAWAVAVRARLNGAEMAARTRDLHRFAAALIGRYEAAKAARGALDFADLVARAAALLTRAETRAWVLYRLDRGIGHILVDEAQDTAPEQWQVVAAIAEEFFAGDAGQAVRRTLFAVGDEKQSIYSFQGADPASFERMRAGFAARLSGLGEALAEPALVTSFRSAPGILRFVDTVFAEGAETLTSRGAVTHEASRREDGARIDLWPLIEPDTAKADPPAWWEPAAAAPNPRPKAQLAALLADEIARMVAGQRQPSRGGRPGAPVTPGDILVLVRKRDLLAQDLIRGLKERGVPVAGADRLSLSAGLAVKDLLALLKVALLPEDDLSLAAVLRSPLFDISEAALFALAHGREGRLWDALMAAPDHAGAAALLSDIAAQADFLRPYELLERVLIRHGGRRRLVARLGPEAEDLVDELLDQALAFEAAQVPTLAGFVAWIEAAELSIKREMEAAGGAVRVMTVHGAKGLEAPVVILADTVHQRETGTRSPVLPAEGGGPALWMPKRAEEDPLAAATREAHAARAEAEQDRLLYVALTRAEDWLILCGAGAEGTARNSWYGRLEAAMKALHAAALPAPGGEPGAEMLRLEDRPVPAPEAATDTRIPEPALPIALPGPAPAEPREIRRTPSELLGAGEPSGGTGRGREAALAHGRAVHRLLELLPEAPAEGRPALAARLLAAEMPALDAAARAAALSEAEAVLAAPWAAEVFGPGSLAEAAIALDLPALSRRRMLGRIDRLMVAPAHVLVIDIKTDRLVPDRPGEVGAPYLAQLGAYAAALAPIWPGREVRAAFLWSAGCALMEVPPGLLEAALARAADAPPA